MFTIDNSENCPVKLLYIPQTHRYIARNKMIESGMPFNDNSLSALAKYSYFSILSSKEQYEH